MKRRKPIDNKSRVLVTSSKDTRRLSEGCAKEERRKHEDTIPIMLMDVIAMIQGGAMN